MDKTKVLKSLYEILINPSLDPDTLNEFEASIRKMVDNTNPAELEILMEELYNSISLKDSNFNNFYGVLNKLKELYSHQKDFYSELIRNFPNPKFFELGQERKIF